MKRWIVILLAIFSILALLAVASYGGAIIYFRHRAFAGLTPDQIKGYDDWMTKKWSFPSTDTEAPPFTDAAIEADRKFREEWEKVSKEAEDLIERYRDYKTFESLQSAPGGWEALAAELPKCEPLLSAFENVVRQPGYEMDFFIAGTDPAEQNGIPLPNFLSIDIPVRLLRLKIYLLLSEGKEAEAIKTAALIAESSRTPKFTHLIARSFGFALLAAGTETWHKLIEHSENPETLRWSFSIQKDLASRIEIAPRDIPLNLVGDLGTLRIASRYGIKTDIRELTARQIKGGSSWAEAEYQKRVILPVVAGDWTRRSRVEGNVENQHLGYILLGGKARSVKEFFVMLLSPMAAATQYSFAAAINGLDFHTPVLADRAEFDLLRISTAAKLYRLENGRPASTWDELVPAYFPRPLADPFDDAGKLYGMTAPEARPYSIGPDKTDQNGAIAYDATNGALSNGDILLESPR